MMKRITGIFMASVFSTTLYLKLIARHGGRT